MTRRRATIALHWLNLVLLLLLLAGGLVPALAWAFVLSGLTMCALAVVKGLMNGPGPKLGGVFRTAHPFLSWGMYAALAAVCGLTLSALLGGDTFGIKLSQAYFVLMSLSSMHAIFHLWRHTALGDGALKRILPKALHGML